MEIKSWNYEEFPEFTELPEDAVLLQSTGDETECRLTCDVEYANIDGQPLVLQILRPFSRNEGEKILPCIVFVQGSAWFEQEIYVQLPMLANLAKKGYVIASVQYRHSGIAPFPAQARDTRNAIRFMKVNAAKYGIDPDKVIVSGDSSGGHTSLFAGILQDDDTEYNLFPGVSADVKCIISMYPSASAMVEDGYPTTINHHLPDSPEGQVMGGVNLRERPDLCRKLSVECNIDPDTPIAPVFLIHGTKDRTVNSRQSTIVYNRLKECGKEAYLYYVAGGDHGGAEYWTDQVLSLEDEFIKKHL